MNTNAKAKLVESFNKSICFNDILEEMVGEVGVHLNPEDVFSTEQLAQWAEENGFVPESE